MIAALESFELSFPSSAMALMVGEAAARVSAGLVGRISADRAARAFQ